MVDFDYLKQLIRNKDQSTAMFGRGTFGNHLRQWNTVREVRQDGFKGLLMLRFRTSCGPVAKDLTVKQAGRVYRERLADGWRAEDMYFNEVLENQDALVTIQGELQRTHAGLYLLYSQAPMRMREALATDPHHVFGLTADHLLRRYCDPSSFDDLMELLDDYPDHVIEFTTCRCPVGSLVERGRNTIIWEVRLF